MTHATTVKLPFNSRILIDCESCFVNNWQLPTPGDQLFDGLPECLHDRHAEIRKRLLQTWKVPLAEYLCNRLRSPLSHGAMILQERLHAWHLALKTSASPTEATTVAECIADLERVLFSERGVEQALTRTIAHLFKETRNYRTNYWVDQAYQKLYARLSTYPRTIATHLMGFTAIRSQMKSAIARDAAAYGLHMEMPQYIDNQIHEQPLPRRSVLAV